jgi:hypothetical protein
MQTAAAGVASVDGRPEHANLIGDVPPPRRFHPEFEKQVMLAASTAVSDG